MNIMVTGCAGFIGSHMTDLILEAGHKVVGIDCCTYAGNLKNISHHYDNPDFKICNIDIANTDSISEICENIKIDWIINFAAETHVDNSIKSCDRFIHSNIIGVKSLLEVCRKHNIGLLHISTDEVYGSTNKGSFVESDKLNPKNPYSATKAAAEHMITAYANTYGVVYRMVRMSNNFGPRQHSEKLIPTIISSLGIGKKIPVYGDGKNVRDWLYVKDCVKYINDVMLYGSDGETYNITCSNEKQNLEVINMICNVLGVNSIDHIEFVPDRLGHDFRYSIDGSKIQRISNINPTSFLPAIAETVKYYVPASKK